VARDGVITGRTAHSGRHAGRLDVYDGVRRFRIVDRRSRFTQLRRDACPAHVPVLVLHDVVCVVVLVQRHYTWNAHDYHVRTWQSGQHKTQARAA